VRENIVSAEKTNRKVRIIRRRGCLRRRPGCAGAQPGAHARAQVHGRRHRLRLLRHRHVRCAALCHGTYASYTDTRTTSYLYIACGTHMAAACDWCDHLGVLVNRLIIIG